MNKLPKLDKRIERFKLSSHAWYLDDTVMVETLKEFNRRIYKDLKNIEDSYGNESVASSREKLNMFVSKWDKEFLNLRSKLGEFKSISIIVSPKVINQCLKVRKIFQMNV